MYKQTDSVFIQNNQQKKNPNETIYNVEKKTTITRSETSGQIESMQTKYQNRRMR